MVPDEEVGARSGQRCTEQFDAGHAPIQVVQDIGENALIVTVYLWRQTEEKDIHFFRCQLCVVHECIERQHDIGGGCALA